jgi:glucose/arabinose dehydrogenase
MYANGVLQAAPVITFSVDSCSERGLLGITLDPNFDSNRYMYVYYTAHSASGCGATTNNVARFVENNGVGINPTVIFSSTQTAGNHDGGNIHFGPDGKLYITIGENANAANSQNVTVKNGKIHRINADGSIPNDNPVFTQTGALPSLYAMGLRNSFDFDFDPLDLTAPYRIFASENGPSCDDEMNRIEPAYNYGWRSGYPCGDTSSTYNTIPHLWSLPNGQCCIAPTGIHIYTGTQVLAWQNHLFMAGNNDGSLRHFYLDPTRTSVLTTNVVSGVSSGTDIVTGPEGAFYYIQGGGYSDGVLKRIMGSGTATPAAPTSTPGPATATPIPPTVPPTGVPASSTPLPPTSTPGGPSNTPAPPTSTPGVGGTATPCAITFSDVDQNNPFYAFIRCLACRQIVSGYSDGTFRWANDVTRGQLAKIIVNAAGFIDPIFGSQTFEDVPETNVFWLYIERLAGRGAISGYACGGPGEPCVPPDNRPYFRWGANATRGQIAKIDAIAGDFTDPIPSTQQTFEDVPNTNPFWVYIERLAVPGVISGYTCGGAGEPCQPPGNRPYFRWGANATRGQMSKIAAETFYPNCQTPAQR